jgi:hypothetical protein
LLQGKQPFDGHGWDRRLSARRKRSHNEVKEEEETAISPAITIPIPREVGLCRCNQFITEISVKYQRYLDSILLKAAIQ